MVLFQVVHRIKIYNPNKKKTINKIVNLVNSNIHTPNGMLINV